MAHDSGPGRTAHPIHAILRAQGRMGTWLAARAGVSQSYASLMLRNKRPATPAFRRACAEALGLPEDVLFHPDPDPDPTDCGERAA